MGLILIQDFLAGPETFLGKFAVIVGDESQWDGKKPPGVSQFIMKSGPANIVYLERKLYGGTAGTEPAYWLPWKSKTGVALDLGDNIKILTTIGSI